MALPFVITLILVLGILAQWLAWRLHVPAIVLLAAAGLLAGPGLGWIDPAAAFGDLLRPLIGLAVAVILFEGGLRLKLAELKQAAEGVARLCSVGLVLAFALGTLAAHYVGGLSWPVAQVLGALLVVTGPTVIMPLLRGARLQRRVASLLKWEGIVNDPLGALLAVLVFEVHAQAGQAGDWTGALEGLGLAALAGGGLGVLGGRLLAAAYRRGHVPEYQKAPMLLGAVFLVFTVANAVQHEAGLLATTVMGMVIGNQGLASLADLSRFKDSLVVVLVSGVFVVLTADLDVTVLQRLDLRAAAFIAALLLVVRPAAILLATLRTELPWNERLLLAWIAPRGVVAAAVAGLFGPALVEAGHPDGALLVPLTFGVVFVTVLAHGLTLGPLAARLGLAAGEREALLVVGANRWSAELARALHEMEIPVFVTDTSWTALRRLRLAGVKVHYGEVLSEAAEETLPLEQVGAVLAATNNDAYNALVCVHFGPEIGRDRAFQLAPAQADPEDGKGVAVTLRGRVVMADDAGYDRLIALHWEGWRFQRTTFREEYDFERWQTQADPRALPLLLVREGGRLLLHGPRRPLAPRPGDTLVSYVPPRTGGAATAPSGGA